jgi:hypothetical protein
MRANPRGHLILRARDVTVLPQPTPGGAGRSALVMQYMLLSSSARTHLRQSRLGLAFDLFLAAHARPFAAGNLIEPHKDCAAALANFYIYLRHTLSSISFISCRTVRL